MSDTPDLQKVISVIMENPALIAEISELMSKSREDAPVAAAENAVPEAAAETSAAVSPQESESGRRNKLLYAMKPYLSKERQRAMDTVITVLDVLHTVRRR